MQSPPNKHTSLVPPPTSQHRFRGFVLLVVWVALVCLLFVKFQDISDWFKLRGYKPPTLVSQMVTQDTMTDYGRKLFYVNHPAIASKANLNDKCKTGGTGGEQTIVLGCYNKDGSGIYVLSVTDPRLTGVEQVTAAHEMLHAAYNRLSPSERDKVDAMLEDYFKTVTDQHIKDVMAAYQKSEPDDVVNEMHSVFGSEIADLPAPLEQYYQQYFINRHAVTSFAAQYQSEFTSRQATIASDDTQLASLKDQIDAMEADLNSQQNALKAQRTELDNLRGSNVSAYNAAVPGYNQSVDAYNSEVEQVKGLIDQYNQLVIERNGVSFEEDQLSKALSSDVAPISQ
jgi:uncharacterized protein YukE